MSKQLSDAPLRPDERQATPPTTSSLPDPKKRQTAVFWPWFGGLLVVGLVIVGVVTFSVWNWLNGVQRGWNAAPNSPSVTKIDVKRSSIYEDLNINLIDIQYTTNFSDDLIHAGPTTARVTLSVTNPTKSTVAVAYYDVVRLLVGKQQIAPTNLTISGSIAAGKTQSGWIDFPVAKDTLLNTLKMQFGNTSTNETLVVIPVTGSYNANQYASQQHKQSLEIDYYYKDYYSYGVTLIYHLNSIVVDYSYNGIEAYAGNQFYTLNFTVDNPNGADVNPGTGYDYIRLYLNGNSATPMDSQYPLTLKAGSSGSSVSATFQAPAGMRSLDILFLKQNVAGSDSYWATY